MSSSSLSNVSPTPLQSEGEVAEDNKENETPGNQVQQPAEESSLKMSRPRRVLQDVQPSEVSEFQLKGPSFLDKLQTKEMQCFPETDGRYVSGSSELNDVAPLDLRRESVEASSRKHMIDGWDSILGEVVVLERNTFLHFSIPMATTPRKLTSQLSGSTDPKDFKPLEFNFKEPEADAVNFVGRLPEPHLWAGKIPERNTFIHFDIPLVSTPRNATSGLSGFTEPKDFKPSEFSLEEPCFARTPSVTSFHELISQIPQTVAESGTVISLQEGLRPVAVNLFDYLL